MKLFNFATYFSEVTTFRMSVLFYRCIVVAAVDVKSELGYMSDMGYSADCTTEVNKFFKRYNISTVEEVHEEDLENVITEL